MRVIAIFCIMCFVNNRLGDASKAVSKIGFLGERKDVETFDVSDEKSSEKADLKEKSDIVCNNKKCVFTFSDDDDGMNKRQISADVHVRISTDVKDTKDTKETKAVEEDNDVPIFKGYAGVDPKDINFENVNEDGKPKQTEDIQVPSLILEPPKFEPQSWYDYLNWKDKTPTTTTTAKPHHPYYPYDTGSGENVIPPGWSSGWKPIAGNPDPNDYYHYNVNRKEDGFYATNPHFVTHCTCTRKPAHAPRPTYHLYPRSWSHYETTTKVPLDGKIAPFDSENKKRKV